MSYEVANEHQSLGQFASNKGYDDLIAASKNYPALVKFFSVGKTEDVVAVCRSLTILFNSTHGEVGDTAKVLESLIRGQKLVLIHTGIS